MQALFVNMWIVFQFQIRKMALILDLLLRVKVFYKKILRRFLTKLLYPEVTESIILVAVDCWYNNNRYAIFSFIIVI